MKVSNSMRLLTVVLLFGTITLYGDWIEPMQEGLVWWEAENFEETSFLLDGYESVARFYAAGEKPYLLSGKQSLPILISRNSDDERGWFVKYKVDVKLPGRYVFWIRAWPITRSSAPFEWRFNKGPWERVDESTKRVDTMEIGTGFREIAWMRAGEVSLGKGEHTILVRQIKGEQNYIQNYDCFMLVLNHNVVPQGTESPRFELEEDIEEVWE